MDRLLALSGRDHTYPETGSTSRGPRLVLVFSGLIVAWAVLAADSSYRLSLYDVGGLPDIALATAMVVIWGAVGWHLVGKRLPVLGWVWTPWIVSIAVGLMVLGLILLMLAWLGVYQSSSIATSFVVAALVGLRDVPGWTEVGKDGIRQLNRVASGRTGRVWLLLQLMLLLLLVVIALAPISDYDSLMYHLDLPTEFLEAGSIYLPVDNQHVSFLGPLQLLYAVPIVTGYVHAANILSFGGFVLTLLLLAEVGRSLGGVRTARTTVILAWASTPMLIVSTTAMVESWSICFIVLTLSLSLWLWLRPGPLFKWVWSSIGLVVGGAVALKLTNGIVTVVLMLWLSLVLVRRGVSAGVLVMGWGVALFAVAPWLLKNVLLVGDPIYPFLTGRDPDMWLQALGAVRGTGDPILASARDPFSLQRWFFNASSLTLEGSGWAQGLNPVVGVGWLLGGLQQRRRNVIFPLVALGVCHLIAIVGFSSHTNLRYLLPTVAVLVAASGLGLGLLSYRTRSILVPLILAASLSNSVAWLVQSVPPALEAVFDGNVLPWMEEHRTADLARMEAELDALEAEQAVLLYEGRAANIDRPVYQDNVMRAWQDLDTLDLGSCPELGVTHFVVNSSHLEYYQARGVSLERAGWIDFTDFAEDCLSPVTRVGDFDIYSFSP